MKLSFFLLVLIFFIMASHARHISNPENGIRIPLTRLPLPNQKSNFAIEFDEGSDIPLQNYKNIVYYGPISIGTPPLEMIIDFDTGSYRMWVMSKFCNSSACAVGNHTRYDHDKSQTYQKLGENFTFRYTGGFTTGFWSRDTVSINGISVENQRFLEATNLEDRNVRPFDGLMGLGYKPQIDSVNVISTLCQQSKIKSPLFSFYLTTNESDKNGGELMLCGSDKSKYRGELKYVNETNSTLSWTIPLQKLSITSNYSKERFTELTLTNHTALIDTGASLIYGPREQIRAIKNAIDPYFLFDICGHIHEYPNVTFRIGNEDFTFTGQDYIVQLGDDRCKIGFDYSGRQYAWTFGDVFLRKYYSVFDMENHRIGFAESIP